jgi:hydroxymethylpyrimidine kinase/phosphomethylpyrimidine kinase/thiamine-phosphate diphosphorylase
VLSLITSPRCQVVDPVLVSTSGASLAQSSCVPTMRDVLFPLATVVTPNTTEASALLDGFPVANLADMEEAARRLHRLGPSYVLVKGGHLLLGPGGGDQAVDVLFDGVTMLRLTAPAVATHHTHGTGCTLASAIAVGLAQGRSAPDAVKFAKDYVTALLRASATVAMGTGTQKPMQHAALVAPVAPVVTSAAPARHTRNACDLRCYAVTDAACNVAAGRGMVDAVKQAVAGGATMVQLREKNIDAGSFVALARRVLEVTRAAGVPLLINDRVDVALAAGADGVHVGQVRDFAATRFFPTGDFGYKGIRGADR